MALNIDCYSKVIAFVKYSAVKIERTEEIIRFMLLSSW